MQSPGTRGVWWGGGREWEFLMESGGAAAGQGDSDYHPLGCPALVVGVGR